jgi:hypothetical protein
MARSGWSRLISGTGVAALAALVTTGCDRARVDHPAPQVLRIDGCLTGSGDDLVLTRLSDADSAGGQATEMYRVVGAEAELRPHVGQQVRIVGEADPADVSIVRKSQPATAPAAPAGTGADAARTTGGDDVDARVATMQKLRLEETELRVKTVTPLNRPCDAM